MAGGTGASYPQQRETERSRWGNALLYISLSFVDFSGCVRRAHPVFVSSWLGVRQNASPQLLIGFFRHRLAPLVRGAFAGYFHCQMREPAIGCSTVPVLDLRGNVHHIARMQLLRRFAPFYATNFCVERRMPGTKQKRFGSLRKRWLPVPAATTAAPTAEPASTRMIWQTFCKR